MKNNGLLILVLGLLHICFPSYINAKPPVNKTYNNYLVVDIGGPAGLGAINFDKKIVNVFHLQLYATVGLSTYKLVDYTQQFNPDIIVPIGFYLIPSDRKIYPVIGTGITYSNSVRATPLEKLRVSQVHFWSKFGFRLNLNNDKMFLQAAYVALREYEIGHRNWAGVSIGCKI